MQGAKNDVSRHQRAVQVEGPGGATMTGNGFRPPPHRRPRPRAPLADANSEADSDAHRDGASLPSPPHQARNSPQRSEPSPTVTTDDVA